MKEEGVKHKKKVFINDSYSTSRSSEVEEVNGFSGTLKNASMSVSARWRRWQMSTGHICGSQTDIKMGQTHSTKTFSGMTCMASFIIMNAERKIKRWTWFDADLAPQHPSHRAKHQTAGDVWTDHSDEGYSQNRQRLSGCVQVSGWFPINPSFTMLFVLTPGWIIPWNQWENYSTKEAYLLFVQTIQEEAPFCPVTIPRWRWNDWNNCVKSWCGRWELKQKWRDGHSLNGEGATVVSKSVPPLKCVSSYRGERRRYKTSKLFFGQ